MHDWIVKNPSPPEIAETIRKSKHLAARTIIDARTGDRFVWPFEMATHAEGAAMLGVPYDRPSGSGDVLFLD